MRTSVVGIVLLASTAFAQNCGPKYNNQTCEAENCCSQYGWCHVGETYCDPFTCLKPFSGKNSSCFTNIHSKHTSATAMSIKSSLKPKPVKSMSKSKSTFPAVVPEFDVCGSANGGLTCSGAGTNGYFYRCCSFAGHCGPKNDMQDQGLYCGQGCQQEFGKCDDMVAPPEPTATSGVSNDGETCGPVVARRCAEGLCCSGSNFCGTTAEYCGADNWCQERWGKCA